MVGALGCHPGCYFLGIEEVAYQTWLDTKRRPQETPAACSWIIRYADQDVPDEVFGGEGAEEAARRRFDQQRGAWSISLYQEVARA